ncbi:hypothetical protein [Rhizobiales bacterium]
MNTARREIAERVIARAQSWAGRSMRTPTSWQSSTCASQAASTVPRGASVTASFSPAASDGL